MPERRTHHSVPLTYKPKLDAVFGGRCGQTIRLGRRYAAGDTVLFFEWMGRPYRSKWGRRLKVTLTTAYPLVLCGDGVVYAHDIPIMAEWGDCDRLAEDDFIDPPTGPELKRVLESFHGPITGPVEAQILRWPTNDA